MPRQKTRTPPSATALRDAVGQPLMNKSVLVALALLGATCVGSVRANVPVATIAGIQHYLATTLDSECPGDPEGPWGPSSGAEVPIASPDSVSIASAGSAEYIVKGQYGCFCSITGNCDFWVLEPSGPTFRILLEGVGTGVIPSHETRHGHLDLEVTIFESMTRDMTVLYQFDGQQYRETACTSTNSENGKKSACHW